MTLLAQITFWTLIGLVLIQGVLVSGFVVRLFRFRRDLVSDGETPKAAVVLCLRGGDPFLEQCIMGLLEQDYPNYEIHIVVDHREDPALASLQPLLDEQCPDHVHLQFLEQPRETCSLKCSSVVQAVRSLDDSVEFVAQLDADTVPHSSWLRELATALMDERVGAATGNRWYMPGHASFASLIRYAWNAAAIVQMYWYRIAWGGTLAVKTRVFRETDLLDKWGAAFCEDTMLLTQLKKAGLRVAFVPSLMMVNREECDFRGFFRWVRRQLLTARLYHPAWIAVAGHGLVTTLVPFVAIAIAIDGSVNGLNATWVPVWGVVIYQISMLLLLVPLEFAVRRIVSARGQATNWLAPTALFAMLFAVPTTQFVYAAALASACCLRVVDWRGVSYAIGGPWDVRLLEYRRYDEDPSGRKTSSL